MFAFLERERQLPYSKYSATGRHPQPKGRQSFTPLRGTTECVSYFELMSQTVPVFRTVFRKTSDQ
jgi:hypothetical protein